MKTTRKVLLAAIGMIACSMQLNAQSCADLYKRANSLKNSKNYAEAITYYQRARDCDANLRTDCNKWIEYCRKRLPKLEISEQEIVIPYQGGDKNIELASFSGVRQTIAPEVRLLHLWLRVVLCTRLLR